MGEPEVKLMLCSGTTFCISGVGRTGFAGKDTRTGPWVGGGLAVVPRHFFFSFDIPKFESTSFYIVACAVMLVVRL